MPGPFKQAYVAPKVEAIMMHLAITMPDTYECLMSLFKKIIDGSVEIGPDILDIDHHAVDGCGYTVLLSFAEGQDLVQINELIFPSRNGLRGIFY